MVDVYDLGSYCSTDSGQLARMIEGELCHHVTSVDDFLFRGFGCNTSKINHVLRAGTDRCEDDVKRYALEFMKRHGETIALADAMQHQSPSRLELSSRSQLVFAVDAALTDARSKGYEQGAVSVYPATFFKRVFPFVHATDTYEFIEVNPTSALHSLFHFKIKR